MRLFLLFFFFNDPATTEIYTLSLHDALPILARRRSVRDRRGACAALRARGTPRPDRWTHRRSEEHTSELQSLRHLVCRLLLEKKKKKKKKNNNDKRTRLRAQETSYTQTYE